jgi:hypothetical protein
MADVAELNERLLALRTDYRTQSRYYMCAWLRPRLEKLGERELSELACHYWLRPWLWSRLGRLMHPRTSAAASQLLRALLVRMHSRQEYCGSLSHYLCKRSEFVKAHRTEFTTVVLRAWPVDMKVIEKLHLKGFRLSETDAPVLDPFLKMLSVRDLCAFYSLAIKYYMSEGEFRWRYAALMHESTLIAMEIRDSDAVLAFLNDFCLKSPISAPRLIEKLALVPPAKRLAPAPSDNTNWFAVEAWIPAIVFRSRSEARETLDIAITFFTNGEVRCLLAACLSEPKLMASVTPLSLEVLHYRKSCAANYIIAFTALGKDRLPVASIETALGALVLSLPPACLSALQAALVRQAGSQEPPLSNLSAGVPRLRGLGWDVLSVMANYLCGGEAGNLVRAVRELALEYTG